MNRLNISIYILAGGQSRRIGHDKLFESVGADSLLERTIANCLDTKLNIKIVAKENNKFKDIPYDVILDDPIADGPLSGIISALKDSNDEFCFITAADLFDLNSKIITNLLKSYQDEQFLGMTINNRKQPLCGIYNKSCFPIINQAAENRNYKMISILENLNSKFMNISITPWRNINFPEDLEEIKKDYV